jgi:hypothetical protein
MLIVFFKYTKEADLLRARFASTSIPMKSTRMPTSGLHSIRLIFANTLRAWKVNWTHPCLKAALQ